MSAASVVSLAKASEKTFRLQSKVLFFFPSDRATVKTIVQGVSQNFIWNSAWDARNLEPCEALPLVLPRLLHKLSSLDS